MAETIRQNRVDALLAFSRKHGGTFHLHPEFVQFDDMTAAEGRAALAKLRGQFNAVNAKLGKLNRMKKRR